jgi:hypothetical protein
MAAGQIAASVGSEELMERLAAVFPDVHGTHKQLRTLQRRERVAQ